jgi:hypothetical protein
MSRFGTIAWSQSVDTAGVLTPITALADQSVRVSGNDIIVPTGLQNLVAAYGLGVNITRAQLVSPSLRRYLNPEISPVDINTLPTPPIGFMDLTDNPILLDAEEALDANYAENGAGAQRGTIAAWLADGPIEPVSGDIRTVRVTGTTTLVANAWTNAALTFDQSLPAGTYQCVGARFFSTNGQLFRLVFVGGQWRPGGIMMQTAQQDDPDMLRFGRFGVWGEFKHNTPPTVDFLANGADTAETGVLDLIKIA